MFGKSVLAAVAVLALASSGVFSAAQARAHHRVHPHFGHVYGHGYVYDHAYVPEAFGYVPYRFGPPYFEQPQARPYWGRMDSTANPDRQMVGIGD